MSPDEWAKKWRYPLIRGYQQDTHLPATARDFLTSFGLPSVMIFEWRSSFEISFSPLANEPVPYNSIIQWGDFYDEVQDREWGQQWVIGEIEFCNGHASICVHQFSGKIHRLDCELLQDPVGFVNSSTELFGKSLLLAQEWSLAVHTEGALPSLESFEELADQLKLTDPRAFENERNFWPSLIAEVLENPDGDPLDMLITSDPARSRSRF